MYSYSLTTKKRTIPRSDGATIPVNPRNRGYAAYLKWVADGNTATPAPGGMSRLAPPAPTAPAPTNTPQATPTDPLELAKTNQGRLTNQACQDAIYAGFQSFALGAAY